MNKKVQMSATNKTTLQTANAKISTGDTEGFLSYCTDIKWTTVSEETLRGKNAVRQWMATSCVEPPKFTVTNLIAEDDFVTALGEIKVRDSAGNETPHSYCDVWRFEASMFHTSAPCIS